MRAMQTYSIFLFTAIIIYDYITSHGTHQITIAFRFGSVIDDCVCTECSLSSLIVRPTHIHTQKADEEGEEKNKTTSNISI